MLSMLDTDTVSYLLKGRSPQIEEIEQYASVLGLHIGDDTSRTIIRLEKIAR